MLSMSSSTSRVCRHITVNSKKLFTTLSSTSFQPSTTKSLSTAFQNKFLNLQYIRSQHVRTMVASSATIDQMIAYPSAKMVRKFSSTPPVTEDSDISNGNDSEFSFAIVDHSAVYEESMMGRHGKQLALAYNEGLGKDEDDIDFFAEFDAAMSEEEVGTDEADESNEIEEDLDDDSDDEEYDDEDEDELEMYNNDGSLATRSESELIALRSGAPAGGNFAIIQLEGFQHKIAKDDLIITNKLKPVSLWKVGQTLTLKSSGSGLNTSSSEGDASTATLGDVLLVGSSEKTYVGLPAVKGAEVDVMVEEITRDKTVIVFKKRRRKNSRRKNGFRREVTFLRVLDIRMPPNA